MKYLIFELFSGVGLCNQLFSLSIIAFIVILFLFSLICSLFFGGIINMMITDYGQYIELSYLTFASCFPKFDCQPIQLLKSITKVYLCLVNCFQLQNQ